MQIIFGAVELDLKEINIQTLYIADIITAFGLEPGVYTHMQNTMVVVGGQKITKKTTLKTGKKPLFML